MKKAALILGSPRKNSNTHILLNEAQKALKAKKAETRIFFLNDLKIKPCQACYYCKKHHTTECAVKDDMKGILDYLLEAEGVLIATPIYFCDVSAQTKLFTDRLFPLIDMNVHPLLPKGKRISFIFTQNQADPSLFQNSISNFMMIFKLFGCKVKNHLLVPDLDMGVKPLVTENIAVMKKAWTLGAELLN